MTKRDSAIALITQHHLKNPVAPSSAAALNPQAAPSSVGITSVGTLSYNSSFIPTPAASTATVQALASDTTTTSRFPVYSKDLFQNNALNQYNATIRQLMNAYSQLQLTNPTTAGALPVSLVVPLVLHRPSDSKELILNSASLLCHNLTLFLGSSNQVPTVASQFVTPYSQAHRHHHVSAPAYSNETRGHRDGNISR